jgi:hypothetical protein
VFPLLQNVHMAAADRTSELLDRKSKLGKPMYGGYDEDEEAAGVCVVYVCATMATPVLPHPLFP